MPPDSMRLADCRSLSGRHRHRESAVQPALHLRHRELLLLAFGRKGRGTERCSLLCRTRRRCQRDLQEGGERRKHCLVQKLFWIFTEVKSVGFGRD